MVSDTEIRWFNGDLIMMDLTEYSDIASIGLITLHFRMPARK